MVKRLLVLIVLLLVPSPLAAQVVNASRININGTWIIQGSGSPEGSVVGAPGDVFISTNGSIYTKGAGTGTDNSGWTALAAGGTATVTSVGLTLPAMFSVTGSPVTTSGTLAATLANQNANVVLAGPSSGSPSTPAFRKIVFSDWASNSCSSGQIPKYDGAAWICAADAGASSGAPTDVQYLTLATDATLTDERVLTAGTGITFTDAGAGSTLTIANNGVLGAGAVTDNAVVRFNSTTGKLVQSGAVILEDDGRLASVSDPTNLQDAATKAYVDAAIAGVSTGQGSSQTTFLVSGGQVVWDSDYTFNVSAASYYISGVLYTSIGQSISLDAADATFDRIDVIAVDNTNSVVKVTGDPSAQPSEPDTDPGTQVKLAIVQVPALSTAPPTITTTSLYAENAGGPGEWNWTSSGSGWTLGSTNNPRAGTKDIEGTTIGSGSYVQGDIPSGTLSLTGIDNLVLYIRSKATWASNRSLVVRLQNAGTQVGSTITIGQGLWGFDSAVTSGYQQIAIPIAQFAVPAGTAITQVRITRSGGSGTIGFYLDDITFQGGGASGIGNGITQDQGDARYTQRANNLSDLTSASTARTNLGLSAVATQTVVAAANGGAGTVNGILKANGSGTVSQATSGTDYAPATSGSLPLFGNGSGGFTNGTVQGNTTKVTTYAGSGPATNDCAKFDANGNVTSAGAACGTSSSSGTVTNTGTLTVNELIVGNGSADVKAVAATNGQIPIGKTSDGSVTLATITAGTNISVTNGGGAITIAATGAAAAPGSVLVEQHAASSSATLDFTTCFTSTYDDYVLEFVNLTPATNNVELRLTVSTDGGSTFESSAYSYGWLYITAGGGTGPAGGAGQAYVLLINGIQNTSSTGTSGTVQMFDPLSSSKQKSMLIRTVAQASGVIFASNGFGSWVSNTAVNAARLAYSSGNIASGVARCYGLAK